MQKRYHENEGDIFANLPYHKRRALGLGDPGDHHDAAICHNSGSVAAEDVKFSFEPEGDVAAGIGWALPSRSRESTATLVENR